MNMNWTRPRAEVQQFATNEYVSACGEHGTTYGFKCNAGNSRYRYNVFLNGADGQPETSDDIPWTTSRQYNPVHLVGDYSPCGTTHEAEDNNDFINGYIYRHNLFGHNEGKRIDVIVWTDNGTNTHCTTDLNKKDWAVLKS